MRRDKAAANAGCSANGCQQPGSIPCEYTDRNGAQCPTTWCESHVSRFGAAVYCRRHADTVAGLSTPFDEPPPLPDLDNRAASLLHWMAGILEAPVREMLDVRRNALTEDLISDYLGAAAPPADPDAASRMWTRRWEIVDHASGIPSISVALSVAEDVDDQVTIVVNDIEVQRGNPPWIAARRKRKRDPADAARERRDWEAGLVAALTEAVDRLRPSQVL